MSEENPYTAPEAALDSGQEALYQPNIFSFNGRIGRLRYLAYGIGVSMLLMFLAGIFMSFTAGFGHADGMGDAALPGLGMMALIGIVSIVVTIMYGKRRFNDLNRSGWWSLLLLIPYVQLLPVIYLVFFPGTDGSNEYGPPPVKNSIGVLILGWMMPALMIAGIVAAIAIPAYVSRAG